jgi:hypothetical protein
MFLDYTLSSDREPAITDLATADETALRYYCFPGDIVMRVGDADLSTRFGWVPVLDFAMALRSIAARLAEEPEATFAFTESGATITFARTGDDVRVTASYAGEAGTVTYGELAAAADAFLARVIDDLTQAHPELADNALVAGLRADA